MRLGLLLVWVCGVAAAEPSLQEQQRQAIAARKAQVLAMQQLGEKLFFDPGLSGSKAISCSSCHQPALAFSSPVALMPGGPRLQQLGNRAVPSLGYSQNIPAFTEHFFENDGNDSIDNGATGGLTWDGRVDRAKDQALIPLFAANEMAAGSNQSLAAAIQAAPYWPRMQTLFSPAQLASDQDIVRRVTDSLAAYLHSPLFYPYTSKFDAIEKGQAQFTDQEQRGFALFNDPAKGNCVSCHFSSRDASGSPPKFSDYGMIGLGLPRNDAIAENRDPAFYDLGLCGPYRKDLTDKPQYCGLFRTPSLRNVALRKHFFHNGAITSLHDAIAFYATRDTHPERWYPVGADGQVQKFNDLPKKYWKNINMDPPFGGKPGDLPALSEQDISDIEAFLGTLTDGYQP
ncbi:cytochrome-c peroxidase [Gallaecimonas xiamenensis]|uniref:cytochrome-c peroxidase n=1 Tax=Gallaecimonas xiamenensis TaxID=1207039 RepID=UPI0004B1E5DA|nr:cytochrome c peroxidase [Gallaecimonas xiamenensis]